MANLRDISPLSVLIREILFVLCKNIKIEASSRLFWSKSNGLQFSGSHWKVIIEDCDFMVNEPFIERPFSYINWAGDTKGVSVILLKITVFLG